jgi:uncharacterized protein
METPPPIAPAAPLKTDSHDKLLIILCHLSAFLGVGLLLPFIIWLVKKGESEKVAAHAREALNFHLTIFLLGVCCAPFAIVLLLIPLVNFLFMLVFVPVCALIALGTLVLSIIAAVQASEGKFYRYPLTLRLVK